MNRKELLSGFREVFHQVWPYSVIMGGLDDGRYCIKKDAKEHIKLAVFVSGRNAKRNCLRMPENDPLSMSFTIGSKNEILPDFEEREIPSLLYLKGLDNKVKISTGKSFPDVSIDYLPLPKVNIEGSPNSLFDAFRDVLIGTEEVLKKCYQDGQLFRVHERIIEQNLYDHQLLLFDNEVVDMQPWLK